MKPFCGGKGGARGENHASRAPFQAHIWPIGSRPESARLITVTPYVRDAS